MSWKQHMWSVGSHIQQAKTCTSCQGRCTLWDFVVANRFTLNRIWYRHRYSQRHKEPAWIYRRDNMIPDRSEVRGIRKLQRRLIYG